ncbi:uncharacterized protein LOC125258626 [Megalobrama amblycephala]|uniref:uncharacterized protein LOC125258626 n=1 Tax=Megalobrama amblycephala TaxID=75352 RepID=UPI0020145F2D|nr:uncharacterized protein LOC125258626 [Megalobrama amblycephala]
MIRLFGFHLLQCCASWFLLFQHRPPGVLLVNVEGSRGSTEETDRKRTRIWIWKHWLGRSQTKWAFGIFGTSTSSLRTRIWIWKRWLARSQTKWVFGIFGTSTSSLRAVNRGLQVRDPPKSRAGCNDREAGGPGHFWWWGFDTVAHLMCLRTQQLMISCWCKMSRHLNVSEGNWLTVSHRHCCLQSLQYLLPSCAWHDYCTTASLVTTYIISCRRYTFEHIIRLTLIWLMVHKQRPKNDCHSRFHVPSIFRLPFIYGLLIGSVIFRPSDVPFQ